MNRNLKVAAAVHMACGVLIAAGVTALSWPAGLIVIGVLTAVWTVFYILE